MKNKLRTSLDLDIAKSWIKINKLKPKSQQDFYYSEMINRQHDGFFSGAVSGIVVLMLFELIGWGVISLIMEIFKTN